ncbi:hypothetical protein BH23PLA1_BH23PLA1_36680 [soil metagenome]
MTKQIVEAVFEGGAFRPLDPSGLRLSEGQHVRLIVDDSETLPEVLALAASVYEGLSESEIDQIEKIALDRRGFFSARSVE